MNLTGQPIHQKPPPKRSDPDHLARVARLPCCICEAFGMGQTSDTQVHHVFHGRYATARAPDHMTIPLCWHHHLGPDGIHTRKQWWLEQFGHDYEYVAATMDRVDRDG